MVDIQTVIVALLKSLKNIYENSNFYKEARIVSFVDRLLEAVVQKLKAKFNLQKAVYHGMRAEQAFLQDIE